MAVAPGQLAKNFEAEIRLMEEQIDKNLLRQKIYEGDAVRVPIPSGMSERHLEVLRRKYTAVHWKSMKSVQAGINEYELELQS